jgi:hypothetical protein
VASHATQTMRAALARRRAAVALAAGCCVFALGALPTAQAAKNSTASSSTAPAQDTVAPHGKRAERAAESEAPPPAPAPVAALSPGAPGEPTGPAHVKHGRALAVPPVAGAPSASGPPARTLDREAPKLRGRRHPQGAVAGEGTESQDAGQSAALSDGESFQGVEALARKQKKEKVKKEKAHKEKVKKEKPAEESEGSSTPVLTPGKAKGHQEAESSSSGEPVAAAASLALSGPGPVGGTGEATTASFTPSAGGIGVHALRAAHRAPRRAKKTPVAGGRATASAPAAATLLAASGTSQSKPDATAAAHAKRPHAAATQPAIVKTFTRIVGVVPTPVRILIAALIALALALAVRSRLSGVRTRRLMRQRGQLLEDVGLLQAALLPVPPARLGPVGTSVAYRPADGPGAGGDFYDVFGLDDGRVAVIVGDVSGHGRGALPHTALVRFTVRAYLEAGLSPRKALQTAGNVLDRQLAGSFATVVAAIYHPRERTLTYSSAGHPPPVVLGDGAEADVASRAVALTTACSAPPLGAGMRTGTRETVVAIPGPARLCFHTDGVTEARVGEDLFGAERLTVALTDLDRSAGATELLDGVAERTDARPDDMAACLLQVEDGSGRPSIAHELLELDAEMLDSGRAERFLRASGMSAAAAATTLDAARAELGRRDSVLVELALGDGPPVAMLEHDNVVHTAALAAVSAS